jgi:dehydrogenase/reductase SDR family member 7B
MVLPSLRFNLLLLLALSTCCSVVSFNQNSLQRTELLRRPHLHLKASPRHQMLHFNHLAFNVIVALLDMVHVVKSLIVQPVLSFFERKTEKGYYESKNVWITGASSGIGRALALELVKLRANVILSARSKDKLEEVAAECRLISGDAMVLVLPVDISVYSQAEAVYSELKGLLSAAGLKATVDVLVNNAGVSSRGSALTTTLSTTEKIMALNFYGPVAFTKAVLPDMIANGGGAIGFISSVQGKIGIPSRSSYAASKHALQGYCDSLRAEMASSNVSVTVLSPGYVQTELSLNALNGDGTKYGVLDATTASGMKPEQVAAIAARAIARKKEDVVLADLQTELAIYLKLMFPSLLSLIMRKRASKEEAKTDNHMVKKLS